MALQQHRFANCTAIADDSISEALAAALLHPGQGQRTWALEPGTALADSQAHHHEGARYNHELGRRLIQLTEQQSGLRATACSRWKLQDPIYEAECSCLTPL